MPPELQQQVVAVVDEAQSRSTMPIAAAVGHLGVSRAELLSLEEKAGMESRE